MRVGLIGAGTRMTKTYVPILRALEEDIVGFVTRSPSTASIFSSSTGIASKQSISALCDENPDYFIVCVTPKAIPIVIRTLFDSKRPILAETPIEDMTLLQAVEAKQATVGILEQWPYLPLEQFKARLYEKNILARPFLVKNDGRSYDYHALAQLRSYIGRDAMPLTVKGTQVSTFLSKFNDSDRKLKSINDAWDIAHIEFDNGAVLCHEFSYACKVAPFRSIQSLRAYSANGTIVTGRIWNRKNDYEIIDVEILKNEDTERLHVDVIGQSVQEHAIERLSCSAVEWINPFIKLDFSDADVAIATHLAHMKHVVQDGVNPLYNLKDATLDQYLMYAIKQACRQGNTIRLRQ